MVIGPATVVTGATGFLGQVLVPRLQEAGHSVRATSRNPPDADDDVEWVAMDLTDDHGVEAAVRDQDVVIHCASAALGDTDAVDIEGTKRLVAAAADAGVENLVYPSIVGIDDIPYSYYQAKRRVETIVEESPVPSTIVRSTQFYPFLADIFARLRWLPVWPLPSGMPLQPIAVEEVASRIVEAATREAGGRLDPIGGPEIQSVGDLARAYRSVRGGWRPIVGVPYPGAVFSAFRSGAATCPDYGYGETTWAEWLRESG